MERNFVRAICYIIINWYTPTKDQVIGRKLARNIVLKINLDVLYDIFLLADNGSIWIEFILLKLKIENTIAK